MAGALANAADLAGSNSIIGGGSRKWREGGREGGGREGYVVKRREGRRV